MALFLTIAVMLSWVRTLQSEPPANPADLSGLIECFPASAPAPLQYFLVLDTFSSCWLPLCGLPSALPVSGQSQIVLMCYGNVSRLPKSACSCQWEAGWRRPVVDLAPDLGFLRGLDEADCFLRWAVISAANG